MLGKSNGANGIHALIPPQARSQSEKIRVGSKEIFVVDDDPMIGDILNLAFSSDGYRVTFLRDGEQFRSVLRACPPPACILIDVLMPGRSGLDLLEDVDAKNYNAPFIVMSGMADIPIAIEAIKRGAFDFIEKPFVIGTVLERVRQVVVAWVQHRMTGQNREIPLATLPGCPPLTQREAEVLVEIAGAATNKEAARNLGLSPRTIEVHRAHIMEKLGAKNAVDLVRIVLGNRHQLLSGNHR
jgi:FixJ family two-component response regulator